MMKSPENTKPPKPFGPWATSLDTESSVRLNTFWQRRMAMLPILNSSVMVMSRGTRAWLAVLTIAVLATPLVYVSRDHLVAASDSKGTSGASDKPVAELLPPLSEAEQKIRDVLSKQAELRFEGMALKDVVAKLQDEYGIQVQLDQVALAGEGIDADTQINFAVKGVSLGTALRLMLRQQDMSCVVRDDVLQITTKDEADNWFVTRVYPVGDISDQDNLSDLVVVITNTVASATWEENGGNGSVVSIGGASSLIISQSQDVHDQVLQLLRSLRTVRRASSSVSTSPGTVKSFLGGVTTPRKGKSAPEGKAPGGGMF